MPITNSREIRNLRNGLLLSRRQKQILVGSLLGDGCLIPNSWDKNYRFQVEQKESHKGYVSWLYREFHEWVLTKPAYQAKPDSWKFRTISHPSLTELATEFYSGRKKILPAGIKKLLDNPLSLSVWAMDDGCLSQSGFTFNTQSFTDLENVTLQNCLADNFGLMYTSLHKDKNHVRLYVRSESLIRLRELLALHILPEFIYKLPKPRRDLILSQIR